MPVCANVDEGQASVTQDPTRSRRRPYHQGALHALLVQKLPTYVEKGRIKAARLASAAGYTRFGVHIWMLEDKLSPRAVKALVEISAVARQEDPALPVLTETDLLPFLLAA